MLHPQPEVPESRHGPAKVAPEADSVLAQSPTNRLWLRAEQLWLRAEQLWLRAEQLWLRAEQLWLRAEQEVRR